MQSIISNNGFGFCKASSFRNCNNCFYRLRCIGYAPSYINNFSQPIETRTTVLQKEKIFVENLENNTDSLIQENIALKEKVQDLEKQILFLNQSKNIEVVTDKIADTEEVVLETTSSELQVYENKNLEVYQQEEAPLKAKKGIFGMKFIEEKPKKK